MSKIPDRTQVVERDSPTAKRQLLRAFEVCTRKARHNIKRLADRPISAASAVDGDYFNFNEGFYEIGNWTSSFFTGMALLAWRETEDEYFLQQVLRLAPCYREKVFNHHLDTHHDLGFLYSLYSVALYKLTAQNEHRDVGLRAAEVLAQRFNSKANFIRAWGHMNTTEHDNVAIIDCLMNLPLLYWAGKEGGNGKFYDIAVRHADMSLKHFVRQDASVCHAFEFDLKSGRPIGETNFCGYSKGSHWARGTAWAIYGFALSYVYTGEGKYLDMAARLGKAFARLLDDQVVPIWDFRLPPDVVAIRDSSAAAVAICGFQELEKHQAADSEMANTKNALLNRLCSDEYLNFDEACNGVLRNGQFGISQMKNGYTSWGDYFLMEALSRELNMGESFW